MSSHRIGGLRWLWALLALPAVVVALFVAESYAGGPVRKAIHRRAAVRRVSQALASPDVERRMAALLPLAQSALARSDSIYSRLSAADRARARELVLEALRYTRTGRPREASYIICRNMGPELHDQADRIGAHLHAAADAETRSRLASALASTGNADAIRRHLSKALIAEPVRRNRLRYASILWWHGLGPVEARLLTRRAGGKLPATESAAVEELKKERAAGSQEAADALCFSGDLGLLSAEQKADLAGRLGEGGRARILAPSGKDE